MSSNVNIQNGRFDPVLTANVPCEPKSDVRAEIYLDSVTDTWIVRNYATKVTLATNFPTAFEATDFAVKYAKARHEYDKAVLKEEQVVPQIAFTYEYKPEWEPAWLETHLDNIAHHVATHTHLVVSAKVETSEPEVEQSVEQFKQTPDLLKLIDL